MPKSNRAENNVAATFSARVGYLNAKRRFATWCDAHGIGQLAGVEALHVAAFVKELQGEFSAPTVKQRLAALRMLFDWLVSGHVLDVIRAEIDSRKLHFHLPPHGLLLRRLFGRAALALAGGTACPTKASGVETRNQRLLGDGLGVDQSADLRDALGDGLGAQIAVFAMTHGDLPALLLAVADHQHVGCLLYTSRCV